MVWIYVNDCKVQLLHGLLQLLHRLKTKGMHPAPASPAPPLKSWSLEGTTGHRDNDKTELQRLYYSTIDSVLGEMDQRFSERNSQLAKSLAALNPETMCENSFSTLRKVFSDHRRAMFHKRMAQLVQL
ncbi:hypothetical protein F7725_026967, partial [Dissostichus mawsoni]